MSNEGDAPGGAIIVRSGSCYDFGASFRFRTHVPNP